MAEKEEMIAEANAEETAVTTTNNFIVKKQPSQAMSKHPLPKRVRNNPMNHTMTIGGGSHNNNSSIMGGGVGSKSPPGRRRKTSDFNCNITKEATAAKGGGGRSPLRTSLSPIAAKNQQDLDTNRLTSFRQHRKTNSIQPPKDKLGMVDSSVTYLQQIFIQRRR